MLDTAEEIRPWAAGRACTPSSQLGPPTEERDRSLAEDRARPHAPVDLPARGASRHQRRARCRQADVYRTGFVTAQLFFGMWLFPLGYLVYRSGYVPRLLGVLLLLDGIRVLIWFVQGLVLPTHHAIIYPGLAVSFIAEVGLASWLLVKGVKVAEPAAG